MNYTDFIEDKILSIKNQGFTVSNEQIHTSSLPHQRDIIKWAAQGGCRAIFASFGLGKTHIQLELAKLCSQEGRALIICPLGVKQEFRKDSKRLGIYVEYVRNMKEVLAVGTKIMITNYERMRDGDIDPNAFVMVSLDEASVLRSYGSKTYQHFLSLFPNVKYKYVCTATPSPNRYKELIHYAGFLGIMDTGQALTRFFQRDSTKANNLTLYPHKEREFWMWMSSWAIFITKPSDLGYNDAGYDLPELNVKWHCVGNDVDIGVDRYNQHELFSNIVFDLKTSASEKRKTISKRLLKALEIINTDDHSHWLVWHHLEDERKAISKAIDCVTVYGSQPEHVKEDLLTGFGNGDYRILATKPEIAGSGCNFQAFCHKNIFLGIDYKFNDFIQSVHRTYRFQQQYPVEVHVIYTHNEYDIVKALKKKWQKHKALVEHMTDIIKEYGLNQYNLLNEMKRTIGIKRQELKGKNYTAVNNDCVVETQQMKTNSVDMVLTSIPFSNHYEYTPSYNDFGHTDNDDHFFSQMDYLTPELLRVLKPGRVAAIHVKDRILFGNVTGLAMTTVNPFHAKTIFHFIKNGFAYMGMIHIETDVVRENNQTYRLGWTEQCKDGSKMGVGSPEYLLLFRKLPSDLSNAYADIPVMKSKSQYPRGRWQIDARSKWNSSGNRLITPEEVRSLNLEIIDKIFKNKSNETLYNYDAHVEVAVEMDECGKLPATFETLKVPARYEWCWSDVNRMRTLNINQSQNRQQSHVCPLQFDIVDRAILRYSNVDDLVYDPFAGLMTVPLRAMIMGRRGYGVELNADYWQAGYRYCRDEEMKMSVPTLFDFLELKTTETH